MDAHLRSCKKKKTANTEALITRLITLHGRHPHVLQDLHCRLPSRRPLAGRDAHVAHDQVHLISNFHRTRRSLTTQQPSTNSHNWCPLGNVAQGTTCMPVGSRAIRGCLCELLKRGPPPHVARERRGWGAGEPPVAVHKRLNTKESPHEAFLVFMHAFPCQCHWVLASFAHNMWLGKLLLHAILPVPAGVIPCLVVQDKQRHRPGNTSC